MVKRLVSSVLLSAAALGALAQNDARPRLVVGIVVDQLRTDYIDYLQSYFGERGFKTLLGSGMYIRDLDFKVPRPDAASASAMLLTGAYPSQTGVPSALVYDASSPVPATRPPLTEAGRSISNDSFSPASLRLSTLADELVIDEAGASKVYSVAADPQQAVILAGHAANSALWINNSSGNWASTSYYGAMPSAVQNRNLNRSISKRLDTLSWQPSSLLSRVAGLPEKKRLAPFKYSFSRQDRDVYKKFAASPLANIEVTDVAIDLINQLNLGSMPGETDMLNVAYTLAPYKYAADGTGRMELIDSYLRLDGQLARLFDAIDRKVGRGNSVIWLSSTGYFDDAMATEPRYRIPGGEFSARRARSLLNSYLSARHGAAQYVAAIRDGQVYFDKRTLEAGSLDSDKVLTDARNFLIKMSGIDDALTINDVISPSNNDTEALRLAIDPEFSGDIFLKFSPGWEVVYDEQNPPVSKHVRASNVACPAFIVAPNISPTVIDSPVDATAIAPTLAGALHIRSPNGARSRSLPVK